MNCIFINNTAEERGGGMYNFSKSQPTVLNCVFLGNSANEGGGIFNDRSSPSLLNCTMSSNIAAIGGAIYSDGSNAHPSNATLRNCIVYFNSAENIFDDPASTTFVIYSNVEGGWQGAGNIAVDPMFVDPESGDYRLSAGSPCIDAADNTTVPKGIDSDLDGNPRFIEDPKTPDTGLGDCPIVDMGSYEFQEGILDCCPWDLDGSGSVGTSDLLELFAQWGTDGSADFDGDGIVGTSDLLILFANWGPCE